ncbi:MAG: hypothetical protein IJ858_04355 [Acidaminococcaceae bacterium]|nr:hypothetical protein [Acidaminococcaceae bacterium]
MTDGSGFTTWSMTVNADRLGESTGLAGFCFYSSEVFNRIILSNQSFVKIEPGLKAKRQGGTAHE